MLVTLKEILKNAKAGKYAVPAVDTCDSIFTEALIQAAEENKSPLIVMVGDFSSEKFIEDVKRQCENASVPVCLHLDHGPSFEACAYGIHCGCTSVMFDGSALPFEENIAQTKKVVEMAHACGVSVEAEIGCIGSSASSNEAIGSEVVYTNPDDVKTFVNATGIDALAVAIGTVHGVYLKEPKLDFDRLKTISGLTETPLVMHGASGLKDSDFKNAVTNGMSKVNLYTNLSLAVVRRLKEELENKPADTTHEVFTEIMIDESKKQFKHHMEVLGSINKA